MTGYDIYNSALMLLDIGEENNDGKTPIPDIALIAVNEIGSDLLPGFNLKNIFDKADIGEASLSAFINGVAMVLSATFNMYNKNAYFTALYNQKRAAVKGKTERIQNNIPYVSGECYEV